MATITALATATPANALAITAGFMITSGGRWCTVSFPDPQNPTIVYTAGHCYKDGITEVSLGNIKIGQFIPEIHDPATDLIAIRLYSNIPSEYSLMSREPLLNPWVPNEGATVCKYGATTQETCGIVLSVDDTKFAVQMPVSILKLRGTRSFEMAQEGTDATSMKKCLAALGAAPVARQ
ncbi:hypothetical protein [Mycolicibacterium frederiksbergense]|uniref:hypothetical protein n=1 Tax=Mycolicibacterium frederiksbergense TaxID=117567 RepID=UPI0039995871